MKVSSFFTNHTKNILQADVTDYEIDQTATLIESLTEEVYPQEKLMLLHEIKQAKQLSQSRNLLQNGDFTSLLGWTTSKDITIQTGNSDFKGYSLHMTGARTTGLSSSIFPTYIYQKIQEVALKPYTRYRIRGFVKQSKNMEIFISRYEQEHHVTLDVENHLGSINPYVQSNIGETQAIPFNNINNRISGDFQESLCKENIASFGQDSHTFSYTLDTGELDLSETPGMELMFQISNPDGFAILGNLEVIEERLLTSEEIQQIHEKENRWKKRKQEQQKEVETSYSQAQQAITQLFANTQFSMLKWETTLQDITMANHLLDRIPNVYHRWLPDKPGSNHSLFIQLKDHISKAYVLYYSRNTIQNGDFSAGFKYWSASRDAKINETDDKSILFIPSWSTQVSQQLHVKPNSQYLLRVRGKKEGKGNGYVKISDVGNHVETLTFTSSDNHTNQMYNESEGFITKTLSIRPYTDQLRIDIGETEGTFMIESIELLHIKV
ncbi:pesticidial crystal protein [Bacillus cereus]|uniref:Pesticidial crystal protein n=1 Tax=Bacillus cereus TaxID=1396 RepID=A0A9W7PZV8_BACCE|nr:pesticidial crystal protein [Bacillus cereus]KAA6448380.1 pesticidial crystal protein [Bacillus cereus]